MSYLLDTMVLLWMASAPENLSEDMRGELADLAKPHFFSSISIWEVAIKTALQKPDFNVDPALLRAGCLANDWIELEFSGEHALAVSQLSIVHGDPFDRALVAQARSTGRVLLTSDDRLGKYGDWVKIIRKRTAA